MNGLAHNHNVNILPEQPLLHVECMLLIAVVV